MPMAFLDRSLASKMVVPEPQKGSRMTSFAWVYFSIKYLEICGISFAVYEWIPCVKYVEFFPYFCLKFMLLGFIFSSLFRFMEWKNPGSAYSFRVEWFVMSQWRAIYKDSIKGVCRKVQI